MARLQPHWPLLVGLLVGAYFRFWGLVPTFLHGDEAEYAIVASYLSDDGRNLAHPRIEGFGPTPFVSQPPFVLYLFAFASHLTGDMANGAVLVSAVQVSVWVSGSR